MSYQYRNYHQLTCGVSLLEVMLTSALAVLIIASLTNLYIKLNHSLLRNQQYVTDSLIAVRLLALFKNEIASAGHIGCAELTPDFLVQPYQQHSLTKANSLQVSDNELIVEYQATPTISILSVNRNNQSITTDDGVGIGRKEILLISDCAHAEINEVKSAYTKAGARHISLQQPCHYQYARTAEAGRLMHHRYYLKAHDTGSDLMMEDSNGSQNTLQTDVTNLHFEADAKGISYSFQYKSTNWSGYAATT